MERETSVVWKIFLWFGRTLPCPVLSTNRIYPDLWNCGENHNDTKRTRQTRCNCALSRTGTIPPQWNHLPFCSLYRHETLRIFRCTMEGHRSQDWLHNTPALGLSIQGRLVLHRAQDGPQSPHGAPANVFYSSP